MADHLATFFERVGVPDSVGFPEGRKREAFSLVEVGGNLLTHDDIESVLGTRPRSYWTLVGARGAEYATRRAPAVFVPNRGWELNAASSLR